MKLVKPAYKQPPNVVQFQVSMEMTKHDIKNYLEKIYNVSCAHIRTRIELGKTRSEPGRGYIIKDDDIKYAYIVLPKSEVFEFPDIFPKPKEDQKDHEKALDEMKKNHEQYLKKNQDRQGLPTWFSF
ncbi:hypothetical protein FQR65_LT13099 [Abscondita terminalis]|nr:hypothetical protein FQR65_LT13099 [Abscondita terminalis]